MKLNTTVPIAAALLALAPAAASSTTISEFAANQISVQYSSADSDVVLGPLDLALNPIAVTALFGEANIDGSISADIYSSAGAPGAFGSFDINIFSDNETFSGTFDGSPLNFVEVDGDYVANFSTTFSDPTDMATLFLDFSGFDPGDQFEFNVAAVPLPPAFLSLLAALGGLGLIARRRKA